MSEDTPQEAVRQPRVLRSISAVEHTIGAILITVIALLVFAQALQRYLPVSGWVWSGELARYSMVGVTFIMCGYLMGQGQHITIQVIDRYVSGRAQRWIKRFANAVVLLICLAFIREGWALVTETSGQVSAALQMPMTYLYAFPLIGFVLAALRAVWALIVPGSEADSTEADLEGELA
ncbi:TRAP transporter small permease [Cryobacterium sp. Hh7]|uniref:TRAP transporter small permease n=1 Tax=Cryobacterium sp. Hh7 TaxID=1259159 RepID=UPI00106AEA11|nr:TRAP transporter small permease [Cryobacterium sp. Hh7]TFD60559.1 TRAP transporter small permease [Cryobacterium sp. Hh7]